MGRKLGLSYRVKESVDILFGEVNFSLPLISVISGYNYKKLLFSRREDHCKIFGGFNKSFFEESDLVVDVVLETVSEIVLSFHSDSLGEPL